MATFVDMQNRIADELARSDLTTQIRNAIWDTIKAYERRRWAWNEGTTTFLTVPTRQWYGGYDNSWIENVISLDSVVASQTGGTVTKLRPRSYEWLQEAVGNTTTGSVTPTDYCYYHRIIGLYPIPTDVITITLSIVYRLPALVNGNDFNAWTNDGEEMVRTAAKIQLLQTVIRGQEAFQEAQMLNSRLAAIESGVISENHVRQSVGVKPWAW